MGDRNDTCLTYVYKLSWSVDCEERKIEKTGAFPNKTFALVYYRFRLTTKLKGKGKEVRVGDPG